MMPFSRSVLVAEDDVDLRALISVSLTRAGLDVTAVGSGGDALAEARRSGPRVCVLHAGLPDLSGVEVCRRLKSCERTAGNPVLLISSSSSSEDVAAAYAAGADDYLPKPFSPGELVHRVTALLARPGEDGG